MITEEEPDLQKQTDKKKITEQNTAAALNLKNYVCVISAGKYHRTDKVTAKSKAEAEKLMLEKYGDLEIKCVKVGG